MSGVFVCYQTANTRYLAGRLYSDLRHRFGEGQIFRDADVLRAGDQWWPQITAWIRQADVILVLMGDEWLALRKSVV